MWVYRYTLKPKAILNARAAAGERHGALLRIGNGYADVHPWPELGDAPLDEQLARLVRGETTPLTARSLAFAAIDARFREEGRNAFEGLNIPASHFPVAAAVEVPDAFDTLKVKCGPDFDPRSLEPWADRRLRLDFNATLTAERFLEIAEALAAYDVDFVEDPCPYDVGIWSALRERSGVRLALDRGTPAARLDVLVIKPAIQDADDLIAEARASELVVTSYMDHAFGQMCAAWVAAKHGHRLSTRCGLFTHVLFQGDSFFDRIASSGPFLFRPEGTGFGFDDLLQNLPWRALR